MAEPRGLKSFALEPEAPSFCCLAPHDHFAAERGALKRFSFEPEVPFSRAWRPQAQIWAQMDMESLWDPEDWKSVRHACDCNMIQKLPLQS